MKRRKASYFIRLYQTSSGHRVQWGHEAQPQGAQQEGHGGRRFRTVSEKSRRPACTLHSPTRPVPPQVPGSKASSQEWLCPRSETAALSLPTEPPRGGQSWSQGCRVRGEQRGGLQRWHHERSRFSLFQLIVRDASGSGKWLTGGEPPRDSSAQGVRGPHGPGPALEPPGKWEGGQPPAAAPTSVPSTQQPGSRGPSWPESRAGGCDRTGCREPSFLPPRDLTYLRVSVSWFSLCLLCKHRGGGNLRLPRRVSQAWNRRPRGL